MDRRTLLAMGGAAAALTVSAPVLNGAQLEEIVWRFGY